jgi:hypothetical protein
MTTRHFGRGPLLVSATIVFCCAVIRAEEGPILPGLDAIPQSPSYVADPSADEAAPRPRRMLRSPTPRGDIDRERTSVRDDARSVDRDATLPESQTPSVKRSGNRGLRPEKPTERPPLTRSPTKTESDRTKSLGRSQNPPRGTVGSPNAAPGVRRNPNDPRSLDRAPIGDRREPLTAPWGASRQQADPRARAALEREKAWREGQNAAPAANARSPRAPSTYPSRTPQAGRPPARTGPASPRTGQPSGSRVAR